MHFRSSQMIRRASGGYLNDLFNLRFNLKLVNGEVAMRRPDFHAMDFDQLWLLYEELTTILAARIGAEKRKLEGRLTRLGRSEQIERVAKGEGTSRAKRKYPKVLPKYFNPSAPAETWSGRGKQPRWIAAALRSGHKLEEFRIRDPKAPAEGTVRRRQRS